jgi:hypothetical protein
VGAIILMSLPSGEAETFLGGFVDERCHRGHFCTVHGRKVVLADNGQAKVVVFDCVLCVSYEMQVFFGANG